MFVSQDSMGARDCYRCRWRGLLLAVLLVSTGALLYASVLSRQPGAIGSAVGHNKGGQSADEAVSRGVRGLRGVVKPDSRLFPLQYPMNRSKVFKLRSTFHFPQPVFSRLDSVLLSSEWTRRLREFLSTVRGFPPQVSLVTATQEHQDVVLNWLISATIMISPPLRNILVLCMGVEMCDLLNTRKIPSLYVSPEMVIDPAANITRVFSQVHIVRMNVLRLMNAYGYNVVNYDSDAILLKNPQVIFDREKNADMIGTFGKGPNRLFEKWGVTLNTGVLLFRANSRIDYYWEAMSRIKKPTTDDQGNVNLALETLDIQWANLRPHQNIDDLEFLIYGTCRLKRIKIIVMLLHFGIVCRHTCTPERRNEYFVWHALAIKENRTVVNKKLQAQWGDAWYLCDDWQARSEAAPAIKGLDWLYHITDLDYMKHS